MSGPGFGYSPCAPYGPLKPPHGGSVVIQHFDREHDPVAALRSAHRALRDVLRKDYLRTSDRLSLREVEEEIRRTLAREEIREAKESVWQSGPTGLDFGDDSLGGEYCPAVQP